MGFLQPISKEDGRTEGLSITVDKYDRVCLSADLKRQLGYQDKINLHLFWDPEYRRIGVSTSCTDQNIVPYPFDKKGYSTARSFIRRCQIVNEEAVKFHYEGMEGNIYVFSQSGRRNNSFQMQKNGDLVRA
jgi:hypothetical protein